MKRLARIAIVALPLMTLAAPAAYAEVKTRDKTQVKFEGMLGRMFNLFGGKSAKEGVEGRTAVKMVTTTACCRRSRCQRDMR